MIQKKSTRLAVHILIGASPLLPLSYISHSCSN